MARMGSCLRRRIFLSGYILAAVFCVGAAQGQQPAADWQQLVRARVDARQLDAALALVDQQLSENRGDLEARGWRGRLLAWQGRWPEAESEYRQVLDHAPNDTDILCGLADVLLWQGKRDEARASLDHARDLAPTDLDILRRRARILLALGDTEKARHQYKEILALDPRNQEAIKSWAGPAGENKHELRIGADGSTFNYTGPAEEQALLFSSRWTPRWSTAFGANLYQRFGQASTKVSASGSLRFTRKDWLNFGGALGHSNGLVPKGEALLEYGHGVRLKNPWVKGLEVSYQQHWFWYQRAHVLVLSLAQLYYLPRDWTWSIMLTGARSGFTGTSVEWVPSGSTRFEFPLRGQLRANVAFANGSENFSEVDQIGHFSARTFAGGLKYRFSLRQDIGGYVAVQNRSQGRSQNSYGMNYGIRF
jgi:tetratricopeptide (TPR) repeat protein